MALVRVAVEAADLADEPDGLRERVLDDLLDPLVQPRDREVVGCPGGRCRVFFVFIEQTGESGAGRIGRVALLERQRPPEDRVGLAGCGVETKRMWLEQLYELYDVLLGNPPEALVGVPPPIGQRLDQIDQISIEGEPDVKRPHTVVTDFAAHGGSVSANTAAVRAASSGIIRLL